MLAAISQNCSTSLTARTSKSSFKIISLNLFAFFPAIIGKGCQNCEKDNIVHMSSGEHLWFSLPQIYSRRPHFVATNVVNYYIITLLNHYKIHRNSVNQKQGQLRQYRAWTRWLLIGGETATVWEKQVASCQRCRRRRMPSPPGTTSSPPLCWSTTTTNVHQQRCRWRRIQVESSLCCHIHWLEFLRYVWAPPTHNHKPQAKPT